MKIKPCKLDRSKDSLSLANWRKWWDSTEDFPSDRWNTSGCRGRSVGQCVFIDTSYSLSPLFVLSPWPCLKDCFAQLDSFSSLDPYQANVLGCFEIHGESKHLPSRGQSSFCSFTSNQIQYWTVLCTCMDWMGGLTFNLTGLCKRHSSLKRQKPQKYESHALILAFPWEGSAQVRLSGQ